MKRILFLGLFIPVALAAQKATIKVDVERVIGEIDPLIYGVFMEPIGFTRNDVSWNTLYGPVYDPESPLANEDGFNREYIEAALELRITNMRWPGGNYVSNYHWEDGIGPKEERPVRKELVWGFIDHNQVGTDEWVQLNRAIGSENVVCINLGTGSLNEARYWVEYCNLEPGTYYSDLRAEYGHPEPFGIKYWCLGNEVDGSPWIMGYKNAEDYCKLARETAKAMKKTDPEISLIANGSSYYQPNMDWVEWNWQVINELRDLADYLSLHRYWEFSEDWKEYMGRQAMILEEKITIPAEQSKAVQEVYHMEEPMYLSFDEWAPHGGGLQSTLASAQFLNAFIRHADMVKMANYTLLTSMLGRDLETGNTFRTPFFHMFKMYSNNCLGQSVDALVVCDTFNVDEFYRGIPYLDVSAVYADNNEHLIINVVNRHREEAFETDILCQTGTFSGSATVREIYLEDPTAPFTFAAMKDYEPDEEEIPTEKSTVTLTVPPHSFTQITVGLER